MDMEYKAFKSRLKMMADRGFSIQESVAFRAPFMGLLPEVCENNNGTDVCSNCLQVMIKKN